MYDEINSLNDRKATTFKDIPPKLLKSHSDIFANKLQTIFNECIDKCKFPNELKLADVAPLFKKNDKTLKNNYRPSSVLPTISKVFERLIHLQMNCYIEYNLSELL